MAGKGKIEPEPTTTRTQCGCSCLPVIKEENSGVEKLRTPLVSGNSN